MLPEGYRLRRLTANDPEQGEALSKSIGWSQNRDDWERSIAWGDKGSLCIVHGEQVVASSIAITYSPALAWIGLVITHADHQRRGLARSIMLATMDEMKNQGVETVMLDASVFGYPLYDSLGFRSLYEVRSWTGVPKQTTPSDDVCPMTSIDLTQVMALDAKLMGVSRPQVLTEYFESGRGWVTKAGDTVTGYAFAKPNHDTTRIGPWYAPSPVQAEALLQTTASACHDQRLRIDIPQPNAEASAMAERLGLETRRGVTRMVYGADAPSDMAKQYAIASFGTG